MDCLSWQKSRLEELFLPYRGQLAAAASRYAPLARLGRSFHATFVALEPGKSPPGAILLFYDFKEQDELEDFRFRPGAWKVRDGALHGAAETSGGSLDSIALFTLPLELEGEIGREAPTILGLGSLRVAPGQVRDGRVWQGPGMEESPVLAAPAMPSGKFLVRFFWDRVELAFGERGPVRSMETRVPEMGRLSLRVASGGSVTRLVIRGTLEPTWAAERLRLLTAGGEGLEPQAPRGGN